MKIAIIGGSGFVGTQLINLLDRQEGYELVNIDKAKSAMHPQLTYIANVLDKDALTTGLQGADTVVLLAAEHTDNVTPTSLYYDVNVQGMRNTLEAMEANGINTLVFTSSVAIYGLDKDNPDEQTAADPMNHYGKSKWEAEQVLQEWCKERSNWSVTIIRPSVIFGEGNRGNVYNLLRQIASGRFMMIGKGENQKSMAYIQNIVSFIGYIIGKRQPGVHIYNYVDKPDFTTNELVEITGRTLDKKIPVMHIPYWLGMLGGYGFDVLAKVTGKKLNISSVRVRKFCAVTQFNGDKVRATGFKAPYTLGEGLARTLRAEFKQG